MTLRAFDYRDLTLMERFRRGLSHLLRELAKKTGGTDLFEIAFEDAPTGMALVGLDGSWIRINKAMEVILERPRHEILQHAFQDYTPEEGNLEGDLALLRECLDGKRDRYSEQKAYLMPDDRLKHVLLSASIVRIERKPLFFLSQVVDIDERVRSEKLLEQALHREQRARRLLEDRVQLLESSGSGNLARELREAVNMLASYSDSDEQTGG